MNILNNISLEIISQVSSILSLILTIVLLYVGGAISKRLNTVKEKIYIDNRYPEILSEVSDLINRCDSIYRSKSADFKKTLELAHAILTLIYDFKASLKHSIKANNFRHHKKLLNRCQSMTRKNSIADKLPEFIGNKIFNEPTSEEVWQIRVHLAEFEKELKNFQKTYKKIGIHG